MGDEGLISVIDAAQMITTSFDPKDVGRKILKVEPERRHFDLQIWLKDDKDHPLRFCDGEVVLLLAERLGMNTVIHRIFFENYGREAFGRDHLIICDNSEEDRATIAKVFGLKFEKEDSLEDSELRKIALSQSHPLLHIKDRFVHAKTQFEEEKSEKIKRQRDF